MPRKYIRKRPRRRPVYRKKRIGKSSVPAIMKPKVYKFKRDVEETLALSSSSAPEGWTLDGNSRCYKQMAFALGLLGDNASDFTNLYKQYRIMGARVRFYFSNSGSAMHQSTASGSSYDNSQLMVRMAPNQSGEQTTLNQSYWQSIQAKKYKLAINGGRPIDIYIPCKTRTEVATSVGSQASMTRPQFVPTANPAVLFEGLNIAIDRLDGQGFSTGSANNVQYVKVITTLYLEMRGVI